MNQMDYGENLNVGSNKQTLMNIVKMRYGDSPVFLSLTQIISGYSVQNQIDSSIDIFPWAKGSNFGILGGQLQYNESPTFTLAPIVGKEFANTFIKPLSPVELLPLINAELPSDLLLKLSVQSINGNENIVAFGGRYSGGSLDFFKIVGNINTLQKEGRLNFTINADEKTKTRKLFLTLLDSTDPEVEKTVVETRLLLGLDNSEKPALVIYGRKPEHRGEIAMITRPVFAIMAKVAMQIDVPQKEVRDNLTYPSVLHSVDNQRPPVIIHISRDCPDDNYVCVRYRQHAYWIAANDVSSKFGFLIIRLLINLAQEKSSTGAIVTIPSGGSSG